MQELAVSGIVSYDSAHKIQNFPYDFDICYAVDMKRSLGGRTTCEDCQSLDIRQLHREGRLVNLSSFSLSWRVGDQPFGASHVQATPDALLLVFDFIDLNKGAVRIEQRVPISWTQCALGGQRPWFICNVFPGDKWCGRRVAKIYLADGPVFACRQCHNLSYASQFERVGFRGIGHAMKIRMRLGGSPNLLDPFPDKPKGLHWQTYDRLRRMHDAAERKLP